MLPIAYPDLKDSVNVMGEFLKLENEAAFQLIVGLLIGTIKPDVGAGYPMHDVRLLRSHRIEPGSVSGSASVDSADIIFTILLMELRIINCSHSSICEKEFVNVS